MITGPAGGQVSTVSGSALRAGGRLVRRRRHPIAVAAEGATAFDPHPQPAPDDLLKAAISELTEAEERS